MGAYSSSTTHLSARRAAFYLLLWVILASALPAFSQRHGGSSRREELEKERQRLEQDVRTTRKLILDARANQKKSLSELHLLNGQIAIHRRLLTTLSSEVEVLNTEIAEKEMLLGSMAGEVTLLQHSYTRVARMTYASQSTFSALLWLLSASSFKQAYDRLLYFREFNRYRQNQIFLLKRTQDYLSRRRQELNQRRQEKNILLGNRVAQKNQLDQVRNEKDSYYKSLQTQESGYRSQLQSYKADLNRIQKEVTRLVKEEVAKVSVEKPAEKENTDKLSGLFEQNKGKLPWPVPANKGVITGYFGPNEDISGAMIQNDGIYISTEAGQPVRAVFGGKVTHARTNRAFGTVVMIRHGGFISVYVNLKDLYVKEGQDVEPLETIGTVSTDSKTGSSELHFLIYNGRTPEDPLQWISKK